MSKITHIDVEVRPSIGFQTVGYTARVQFDQPKDIVEALAEASVVREALTLKAHEDVQTLVDFRVSSEAEQKAQAPHAPQPTAPTAPLSGDGWAVGNKPNGKGSFRYLTTAAFSSDQFRAAIKAQLPALGIDPEHVDVFDDRVGNYGLEKGHDAYTAGKLKAKDGTPLASALGGKSIIGGADFGPDGSVKVSLSRDGKAAVQALTIAANLSKLEATPI